MPKGKKFVNHDDLQPGDKFVIAEDFQGFFLKKNFFWLLSFLTSINFVLGKDCNAIVQVAANNKAQAVDWDPPQRHGKLVEKIKE